MSGQATLTHEEIAARIPHQDRMCLLDRVESWDQEGIVCHAVSHRDSDNPLRAANRLGATIGIEYAAQAMAVHGALLVANDACPKAGYLTSVRNVTLHVERLDDIASELDIVAARQSGDAVAVLYSFSVSAAGKILLEGRATVMLDAEARSDLSHT